MFVDSFDVFDCRLSDVIKLKYILQSFTYNDAFSNLSCHLQYTLRGIRLGNSMFCFGYGIYTWERSSREYIS